MFLGLVGMRAGKYLHAGTQVLEGVFSVRILKGTREGMEQTEVKECSTLVTELWTNHRTLGQFVPPPTLLTVKQSPKAGTDLSRETWLVRTPVS